MTTTAQLASDMIDLGVEGGWSFGDLAAAKASLATFLTDRYGEAAPADLLLKLNQTITAWNTEVLQRYLWFTTAVDAGFQEDGTPASGGVGGWVAETAPDGTVTYTPGRKLIADTMQKGDPARIAWVFQVYGKPPANIVIGGYKSPGNQTFTDEACRGYCRTAGTGAVSYPLKKNGSVVGNVSFSAGATTAVFAFTGGEVTLADGDIFEITSPSTQDATHASSSLTFAGD